MKRVLNVFILFTIFLFFTIPCLAVEISSCTNITQSGSYVLANDIFNGEDGPCIRILANDVTLLCQGKKIYSNRDPIYGSSPNSIGILISEANNVRIENCVLHNFLEAIGIEGASNVIISNSLIFSNVYGVGVTSSSDISIHGTEIHTNYQAGVVFYNVNRATVGPIFLTGGGTIKSYFHENIGYSIIFENCPSFFVYKTVFLDSVPLRILNSSGYVIDNGFTGNFTYFNYISGNVAFWDTPTRNKECDTNYLGGCGIGGNYYGTFSINCRNDDKDSFCDSGYTLPIVPSGPTIIDRYPLAYPQPYLKKPELPSRVNVLPGSSVDINIQLSWSHYINPVSIQCSVQSPLSCWFISHNCNFNQRDGSCQYVYRIIAPSNTPIGGYEGSFIISSGDCRYEREVDINVYSQACSGTVTLTLSPNRIKPGESTTATISGLSSCGGVGYIRLGSCTGPELAECSISGSGCSVNITPQFGVGTYNIYGCFDINGNGVYESGEYDVKVLEIYEEVGPSLGYNITGPGEIRNPGFYVLANDIYSNLETAIKILANDVTLYCGGKMISAGTENKKGISVIGANNVEIIDCVLSGFDISIYISNSNNINIMYSKILSSNIGIKIDNSYGSTSNINVYSTDFSNNNFGIVGEGTNGIYLSCERGRLFEKPEVINSFLGSINNSIVLNNVNPFIIACSEFTDRIPLKITNSNGYVFDNKFYGDFERVEVSGNVKFNYIYKVKNIAGTNVLLGCGGGGNYYSTNDNCRNRDLDSFCDSKYRVPGTSIYDELPLANPQPYLVVGDRFYGLQIENITVEEGSSTGISIPLSWNYKINKIEGKCNVEKPLDCRVNLRGCDTNSENGSCYAEIYISVPTPPPNVNYTGIYGINVTLSSGDCIYTTFSKVLVYKIVYPPLYPEIPFLTIPFVAIALIFGFGTAMEIGISKRGGKSNGIVLLSFVIVGIIALVLLKLITSFVLMILTIIGALMFAVILSKILGGW